MSTQLAKQEIQIEGGMLSLKSLSDAMQFAQQIIKSGLAPTAFKNPEAVLVAMQHGAELGLKPMASLQHISVIGGRPALYGKALPGVILATGLMEEFTETIEGAGDDMAAVCRAKRKGLANSRTEKFSVADAKRAGLWGKSGPWSQYPKDMLRYKARARCLGSLFADVLCGMPVFEDYQDVVTSPEKEIAPAPATPDPLIVQINEQPEPEPIAADEAEFQIQTETEKPTTAQIKKLFAALKKSGNTVEEFQRWLSAEYGHVSTADITTEQYPKVMAYCADEPPVDAE